MEIEKIIIYFLLIINEVTFFLYGIDKFKATKNKWRIPEKTLLGMAALGGSIGAFAGMKFFHHKTLHKKFAFGVPLVLLLQIGLAVYFYLKIYR